MIKLNAQNTSLTAEETELLTSGRVGLKCRITFSDEWTGLTRLAIFRAGSVSATVEVGAGDITVPWECLQRAGKRLFAGVCGINDLGDIVLPSVWCEIGVIEPGADPDAPLSAEPSATLISELMMTAQSVRDDADAGEFDGEAGRGISSIERTAGTGEAGTADTYTVTYTDGTSWSFEVYNGNDGESSGAARPLTVTLAPGDWETLSQTVAAPGVTSESIVIVAPAPDSRGEYISSSVCCTGQGEGTLTFECSVAPDDEITVNIAILEVSP